MIGEAHVEALRERPEWKLCVLSSSEGCMSQSVCGFPITHSRKLYEKPRIKIASAVIILLTPVSPSFRLWWFCAREAASSAFFGGWTYGGLIGKFFGLFSILLRGAVLK